MQSLPRKSANETSSRILHLWVLCYFVFMILWQICSTVYVTANYLQTLSDKYSILNGNNINDVYLISYITACAVGWCAVDLFWIFQYFKIKVFAVKSTALSGSSNR